MPLNHQAGYKVLFKTTLNILVNRALMHHISFLSDRMIYALTLDRFIQYCAKVMQTIIDEYRDISAIFNEILP